MRSKHNILLIVLFVKGAMESLGLKDTYVGSQAQVRYRYGDVQIYCALARQVKYRVFIKYCVFSEDFKIYSGLLLFSVSLGVSVCTHTRAAAELAEFRTITKF